MKSAKHKKIVLASIIIAAVVLCTLPFLFKPQNTIYVYTLHNNITEHEQSFIKDLGKIGFNIKHRKADDASKGGYALWFAPPEYVVEIQKISHAKYDFIYSEAHYPFNWHSIKNSPIMLTPHQNLYEHYMRSNIKSAVLDIKTPTAAKRFQELYQWLKNNS